MKSFDAWNPWCAPGCPPRQSVRRKRRPSTTTLRLRLSAIGHQNSGNVVQTSCASIPAPASRMCVGTFEDSVRPARLLAARRIAAAIGARTCLSPERPPLQADTARPPPDRMFHAARQDPVDRLSDAQSEQRRANGNQYRDSSGVDIRAAGIHERDFTAIAGRLVLEQNAGVHGHHVFRDLIVRHDNRAPVRFPASRSTGRRSLRHRLPASRKVAPDRPALDRLTATRPSGCSVASKEERTNAAFDCGSARDVLEQDLHGVRKPGDIRAGLCRQLGETGVEGRA